MPKPTRDEVLAWVADGIDKGYCSEGFCIQHDGTPFNADEAEQFEAGDDPCVPAIRVFVD